MTSDRELLAAHRREVLDQMVLGAIEGAERAGDKELAAKLQMDRLEMALEGFTIERKRKAGPGK
jgi:hypothetical protein